MMVSSVVSQDFKPANCMLCTDGLIKIADFGFACKIDGRDESGFNKSVVGTPGYMAPEILAHKPYQGHVADIFSLAVILFAMYSGHPPFELAKADDAYYQYFALNRVDLFW